MNTNLGFSRESALLAMDTEFVTEDFGEVDLKWYVTPLSKPVFIHLGGHQLTITHAIVDSRNKIQSLPSSEAEAIVLAEMHNVYVEQGSMDRNALLSHIATLQKRLDAVVPGRVPKRGPKPKTEKAA